MCTVISGNLWELQDDASLRKIDEAAVTLLRRTGARIQHEEVRGMLEGAGCQVARSSSFCRFPEKLIRDAIENFRGEDAGRVRIESGWTPNIRHSSSGSYPHLLEWPQCRRRLATQEDVRNVAKMQHVLPEFDAVGQVLTCSEVDPRVEPIWNIVTRMGITDGDLLGGEVLHAENIKQLVRLGEIHSGEPGDSRFVVSCDFVVAPLNFGRRMLRCMLEKRKHGLAHCPGTMPISGISAPVTIAGAVTVCVAELLAGWAIGYLIAPDLPARGIVASGSMDMRTTRACFGSPEALLQDLTTVQLCRRLYGLAVNPALGYVDCKRPGMEAVFEKMFALLSFPFLGKMAFRAGGLLSAGQDYSPVQQLLDLEIYAACDRFLGQYGVNDDTLATDLIEQIITDGTKTFLDTDHTLAHYAAEQWYPRWFDRKTWQGDRVEAAAEKEMLDRINAYWQDAVERYERPDLDETRLKEARQVLAAAEKEKEQIETVG